MTFFHRLRSAWLYLRYIPYFEEADAADYWTDVDQRAYEHFMDKTLTGQKLRKRCANLVNRSAVNATRSTSNPLYHNGWSSGIAATFTWLDGHLPKPPPPDLREYADNKELSAEELIEKYTA